MKYEEYKILTVEQKEKYKWYANKSDTLSLIFYLMGIMAIVTYAVYPVLGIIVIVMSLFAFVVSLTMQNKADKVGNK